MAVPANHAQGAQTASQQLAQRWSGHAGYAQQVDPLQNGVNMYAAPPHTAALASSPGPCLRPLSCPQTPSQAVAFSHRSVRQPNEEPRRSLARPVATLSEMHTCLAKELQSYAERARAPYSESSTSTVFHGDVAKTHYAEQQFFPDDRRPSLPNGPSADDDYEAMVKTNSFTDPRQSLMDFLADGDHQGPGGMTPVAKGSARSMKTSWFAIYRPTSDDAIDKMRQGHGRGKGLNIKGKSAKCGKLSGYVPFLQISENSHKKLIGTSPKQARIRIYYSSASARETAYSALSILMDVMVETSSLAEEQVKAMKSGDLVVKNDYLENVYYKQMTLHMDTPRIDRIDTFAPAAYGVELPERLMREAYIIRSDITASEEWQTGRKSEPAFMDMNLHTVREQHEHYPRTVIYQYDAENPMNPRGLILAYQEKSVGPVVSDFDAFLFGSAGMSFKPLPDEQARVVDWSLKCTEEILASPDSRSWTERWLEILKRESDKGFHPEVPKGGFGDPTTSAIVQGKINALDYCGAVRHGAECFNYYFPQEMDTEYLVIWDGFDRNHAAGVHPWRYLDERQVREFLLNRVPEGYSFPLNPAWVLRDSEWFAVLSALMKSPSAQGPLKAWFPPSTGLLNRIQELHYKYPSGFQVRKASKENHNADGGEGLSALEAADLAELKLRRHQVLRRAKVKLHAFLALQTSIMGKLKRAKTKLKGIHALKQVCN